MQNKTRINSLPFMKMHGAGNDFVIFDSRNRSSVITPALARRVGDRHKGVGFDQLAELLPCDDADFRLDFWNADGSRAGACGNATRCVSDFVMRETGQKRLSIRTRRGLLNAMREENGSVSVNMGHPQLTWQDIPLAKDMLPDPLPLPGAPAAVGMGNPHCVFFVEDAEAADVATEGAKYEHDPLFPQAANVEFVSVPGPDKLRMRVWERGTGITLACGSGACAAAVAAHKRGLVGKDVTVIADGGTLSVWLREDGVWLSGPVRHVFDGILTPEMTAGT